MIKYIEQLLQGQPVVWKPLGEVAEICRGRRLVRKELREKGSHPVYQNSMTPLGYYEESNVSASTTFVIAAGAAGSVGYCDEPFWAADDVFYFLPSDCLDSKYLYHYLQSRKHTLVQHVRKASVPRLSREVLKKLLIPIPPLSVQAEIVRILDSFTSLTAELEAELEARRAQYAHYRDELLKFTNRGGGGKIVYRPLGEIGRVRMCKRILKAQTTSSGDIPFYKIGTFGGQADAFIPRALFEEYKRKYSYPRQGDILISASGTIGRAVIYDGSDAYFQDSNIVWLEHGEELVLNKYLFYLYRTIKWRAAEGGTIQRLYNDAIRQTLIPIPPLEEQERIVRLLDEFDTLTSSLTEGLPREIELRRQQYAYYRDQLLSFPRDEA